MNINLNFNNSLYGCVGVVLAVIQYWFLLEEIAKVIWNMSLFLDFEY